jgi:hypothetical protein
MLDNILVVIAIVVGIVITYAALLLYLRAEINAVHDEAVRMYRDNKELINSNKQDVELLKYRVRNIVKSPYREE